jgi:diguanylate cyclase (GGDEF)-like protein/putative nucleotidyltransferase with HDIG domain
LPCGRGERWQVPKSAAWPLKSFRILPIVYPESTENRFMQMAVKARVYWLAAISTGLAIMLWAGVSWRFQDESYWRLALYLIAGVGASRLKIKLPGVLGTLSMNYLFIIVALLELQLESAVLIGVTSVLAQVLIRPGSKPKLEQVAFSSLAIPVPILCAHWILNLSFIAAVDPTRCVALVSASMVYFLVNTASVSCIIGLTTNKSPFEVWRENMIWTSPQYLVGGALAGALHLVNNLVPWQGMLLSGPPLYLVYRSYTLYLGKMGQQQQHISEMAELHWRTIEALALAIEAKDETTAAHLKRVQVYAVEIAKELKLSASEIKAVEAAALLHDIGKLAVPEYIISKPGRLTPEEFEKMKIHPIVGAEILQRVNFPYPVVPIVRSHHEKFDGSGYPDGLCGEQIPIGARILAAVDCLDAVASDRQYRRAKPIEEALAMVEEESGKSFDPQIVALLRLRHKALEEKAKMQTSGESSGVSSHIVVERGAAPATGFAEANNTQSVAPEASFTLAIASARREVQLLVEIANDLGNSLSLDETLALMAMRLRNMVPYDSIVIYIRQDGKLLPQFVQGESYRLFSSLEIPVGHGLSGWVVENDMHILNGNPAVEPGYLNDPQKITTLRSAVSVPLPGQEGVIGALSLYRLQPDAFTQDHLRVLLAVRSKAGQAIENSLRFSKARYAAEKDELTGLLNAGTLFRLLEAELVRAAGLKIGVAIILIDLNGFKQANDRHGHLAGNRVLQEIATGLIACCRVSDHVARLGGDEFVLVLPDASPENVGGVLRRIQSLGPEAGMKACGESAITISSGVASYPIDGTDAESLLERADQLMYECKKESKKGRSAVPSIHAEGLAATGGLVLLPADEIGQTVTIQ